MKKRKREAAQNKAAEERAAEQQRSQQQQAILRAEQKRLAEERNAYELENAERWRIQEEQRFERERKRLRKQQLKTDESALFRHYNEYLEHFPLGRGEYRNQYYVNLLANRHMPDDPKSDLALAIQYAKDHWQYYIEYRIKEVEHCAKLQRKILAERELSTQGGER
jgi:hypothetical protein